MKDSFIDEALDSFDFEKVHKVMTFLTWIWAPHYEVPTIKEMRQVTRRLLQEVENNSSIESGGFKVQCYNGLYELSFVVTQSYGGLDHDEDEYNLASP